MDISVDKLELFGRAVLLELEEAEKVSKGGIILAPRDESKYRWQTYAKVVNKAPNVNGVKLGDVVLFERHAGRLMQFGGRDYLLVDMSDLLAKLTV